MEKKSFPCTGCGCCCKIINVLHEAAQAFKDKVDVSFPYKWDETGRCEKLGDDNKCMVYDNRPLICKVDEIGELFGLTTEENHQLTAKSCNKLILDFGIDESFKVVL